jgi:hypothetical protein
VRRRCPCRSGGAWGSGIPLATPWAVTAVPKSAQEIRNGAENKGSSVRSQQAAAQYCPEVFRPRAELGSHKNPRC